jgi:hypothetical protein
MFKVYNFCKPLLRSKSTILYILNKLVVVCSNPNTLERETDLQAEVAGDTRGQQGAMTPRRVKRRSYR